MTPHPIKGSWVSGVTCIPGVQSESWGQMSKAYLFNSCSVVS